MRLEKESENEMEELVELMHLDHDRYVFHVNDDNDHDNINRESDVENKEDIINDGDTHEDENTKRNGNTDGNNNDAERIFTSGEYTDISSPTSDNSSSASKSQSSYHSIPKNLYSTGEFMFFLRRRSENLGWARFHRPECSLMDVIKAYLPNPEEIKPKRKSAAGCHFNDQLYGLTENYMLCNDKVHQKSSYYSLPLLVICDEQVLDCISQLHHSQSRVASSYGTYLLNSIKAKELGLT